MTATSRTK